MISNWLLFHMDFHLKLTQTSKPIKGIEEIKISQGDLCGSRSRFYFSTYVFLRKPLGESQLKHRSFFAVYKRACPSFSVV